jgi:hypothetical protein
METPQQRYQFSLFVYKSFLAGAKEEHIKQFEKYLRKDLNIQWLEYIYSI